MSTVFISHSWHDKGLARKIAATLQAYGVGVWLDEAEIKIGDSLIEKIREGIDQVDYVIALLSGKSVASQWVKRELDIAMNQEIEGKTVKVLPILAETCILPGFLQGKLYADMSTNKAFREAIPMLLARLNVDPAMLKGTKAEREKDRRPNAQQLGRAQDLIARFTCDDLAARYEALHNVNLYDDKPLFFHVPFVEALVNLAQAGNPKHVRRRAIEVLGHAPNEDYAEYVLPFLRDDSRVIVVEALRALASMEADDSSYEVLELMRGTLSAPVRQACLNFFASVSVSDKPTVLAITETLIAMTKSSDSGTLVRIAGALGKQWGGFHDCALEGLLGLVEHDNRHVREAARSALTEEISDSHVFSPALRKRLVETMQCSLTDACDTELGKAWMSALLSEQIPRKKVWEAVLAGDENAVESFLSELDDYHVDRVLDAQEDIDMLVALLLKHPSLDEKICEVLAETHAGGALRVLAGRGYQPGHWLALDLACGLAKLPRGEPWDDELRGLLAKVASVEMVNGADFRDAFVLLARVCSGDISLEDAIDGFPKLTSWFFREDHFRSILRGLIERHLEEAPKNLHRHLSALKRRTFAEK